MDGFFEALRFHLPGHPLEAGLLAAAVGVAGWSFRRIGGAAAGAVATAGAVGAFVQTGHPSIPVAIALSGAAAARRGARFDGRRFLGEAALVMGGFAAYEAARFQVVSPPEPAIRNSERLVDFEQALGLFHERAVQGWFTRWEPVATAFNEVYSHGFLAAVAGVLLWLYATDRERYAIYRNGLGASAALAVVLIAAYPAAPPRLMPWLGIEDTVAAAGREHAFANEYAAIPSLHVGWLALTGYVLALRRRGRGRWLVGLVPGAGMLLTTVVTGNHFWVDGAIGSAVSIGPAAGWQWRHRLAAAGRELAAAARAMPQALAENARAQFTASALGGLLGYLLLAQVLRPGFTDFWGYLVFQVAATLLLLVLGETLFAREGGLSWLTHGIAVVCTFADVLGTDGDLYARIDEYDKLTHFMGVAAVTAGAWEVLRAAALRPGRPLAPGRCFAAAVGVGVAVGIGWEVYEYLGDVVFHTTRSQGSWDTFNDLISDTAGALALAGLLWWQERRGALLAGAGARAAPRG